MKDLTTFACGCSCKPVDDGEKFYDITDELMEINSKTYLSADLTWKDCFEFIKDDFNDLCYYAYIDELEEDEVVGSLNSLAHSAILCRMAYEKTELTEKRFNEIIEEMKEIHDAKRHDYASDEDRFSNLTISEKMGIPAWKGCLVRISDKYSRLEEFTKKEELKVKDESITDTLNDMANYAIICRVLYERSLKSGKGSCKPSSC